VVCLYVSQTYMLEEGVLLSCVNGSAIMEMRVIKRHNTGRINYLVAIHRRFAHNLRD
jgi:hypothetical protein